ncbi:hypothetical protein CF98_26905 [Halopseudomonas bauzanensis]|nr:hypothetical protein CF98_26905 [Halopseudomonas bauzanensis]
MHQQGFVVALGAAAQRATLEYVAPDGIEGFGQCGGLNMIEAGRERQALRDGRYAILSIATTLKQRANRIPLGQPQVIRWVSEIAADDLPGNLEAGNISDSRGDRIPALALGNIRPVDTKCRHTDQYFALAGHGYRTPGHA